MHTYSQPNPRCRPIVPASLRRKLGYLVLFNEIDILDMCNEEDGLDLSTWLEIL
jgi:hypothetical protein